MSGATAYKLPTGSELVSGTAVESKYKEAIYNEVAGKHEEIEKTSTIATYKGGSLLGWNLYAKSKTKFILYDNSKEAKGTYYGTVSVNEHESIRDWFGPNGLKFNEALWIEYIEGELEKSVIFCDIE